MDEIIYELRDHSSGLNCGRWDYIFSVIKKFRHDARFILPDRSAVTMTSPFMDSYVFDKHMTSPNQFHVRREDVVVRASDLLNTNVKGGKITDAGVRDNIADAATAEISRSQLYQWVRHSSRTAEGTVITPEYAARVLREEAAKLDRAAYPTLDLAVKFMGSQMTGTQYDDFLTTLCYDSIVKTEDDAKL
ncbi:hypothetical protein GGF45_003487 [Coemansia sp. RSA 551]|nr:hypothetical protein GGF45_003487 [Coemansia sp. RSA 551]